MSKKNRNENDFRHLLKKSGISEEMEDLIVRITEMGRAVTSDFEYTNFIMIAHIKLEQIMRRRIVNRLTLNFYKVNTAPLKNREALSGYKEVCAMSYALGIISSDLYNWLKKFNKIRNDVAHKDEYELNNQKLNELRSVYPALYATANRTAQEIGKTKISPIEELKNVLAVIHIQLDSGMMEYRKAPEHFEVKHARHEEISDDHPICCGAGINHKYYKQSSAAKSRENFVFNKS